MFKQNLMYKLQNLPKLSNINGAIKPKTTRQALERGRNFATAGTNLRQGLPKIQGGAQVSKPQMTTMEGLSEFLLHPLTWDRNNGYFNILLGLAIFGYCFCTACHSDGPRTVSYEEKQAKK